MNPLSALSLPWLHNLSSRFDDVIETQFQVEVCQRSWRYWRFVLLFGLLLVLSFAVWDAQFFPETRIQLFVIRLGIIVPGLLGVLRLSIKPLPPSRLIQVYLAAMTWITAAGVTVMMAFAEKPLAYYVFFPGVMIGMIYLAALLIAWTYALISGALILAFYIPFTLWIGMPTNVLVMSLFFLISTFCVAVICSFEIERFKRRDFLGRRGNETLLENLVTEKQHADLANAAKSTFLAAASHDLRQPVQAISNFVAVLSDTVKDAKATYLLSRIDASLRSLDELFLDLLDISRLDAGMIEHQKRATPAHSILEPVLSAYALQAAKKNLQLIFVKSRLSLMTDPLLLERILGNLLDNAIRYTSTGKILVGCRRRGDKVAIQVLDTGCGIPQHLQELVFSEFFQVGNAERNRARGFGLGLSIVRRLCSLLDHELRLTSHPNRGSTFEVLVPLASHPLVPTDRQVDIEQSRNLLAGLLILLIDDEPDILESCSLVLRTWQCHVLVAQSSAEAVDLVRASERLPDLAIVDFRLRSDETGHDALELIRAECGCEIPGIILTGDTSDQRISEALRSGMPLLHKPLMPARLQDALRQCLEGRAIS